MHLLASYNTEVKSIRDPIYGFISVPIEFLPILDHEYMQRLRWVSQLPLEQLVYPSAMHSRFEHSLGCMYLAMFAAITLVKDNESKLNTVLQTNEDKKDFVFAAGIAGLLHDLGHAPFSHTLEDATKLIDSNGKLYDHEKVSFNVAKEILDGKVTNYTSLALDALNKDLDKTAMRQLAIIIQQLIDSPHIDVDKGDYLLRDSYHCGVTYGLYDYRRLWGNITIDDNYSIAVNEKGALEAWSLMLARHKMHTNVYKHHVRDFSDALLMDIIKDVYNKEQTIIPTKKNKLTNNKADFLFWTDDNFLKSLYDIGTSEVKTKIENFKKRKLYKRCSLDIDLPISNAKDLDNALNEARQQLSLEQIETIFIITRHTIIPIDTPSVSELLVRKNKTFIPLSTYLEFPFTKSSSTLTEEAEEAPNKRPSTKLVLRIYVENTMLDKQNHIKSVYSGKIDKLQF